MHVEAASSPTTCRTRISAASWAEGSGRDDDNVLAIEDVRDERVHVGRTRRDFEPWLKSVKEGRHVLPAFGLCGRCGEIHCDRDLDLEIFRSCVSVPGRPLVEIAVQLHPDTEVEA